MPEVCTASLGLSELRVCVLRFPSHLHWMPLRLFRPTRCQAEGYSDGRWCLSLIQKPPPQTCLYFLGPTWVRPSLLAQSLKLEHTYNFLFLLQHLPYIQSIPKCLLCCFLSNQPSFFSLHCQCLRPGLNCLWSGPFQSLLMGLTSSRFFSATQLKTKICVPFLKIIRWLSIIYHINSDLTWHQDHLLLIPTTTATPQQMLRSIHTKPQSVPENAMLCAWSALFHWVPPGLFIKLRHLLFSKAFLGSSLVFPLHLVHSWDAGLTSLSMR